MLLVIPAATAVTLAELQQADCIPSNQSGQMAS